MKMNNDNFDERIVKESWWSTGIYSIVCFPPLLLMVLGAIAYRTIAHGDDLEIAIVVLAMIPVLGTLLGIILVRRVIKKNKRLAWLKTVASPIAPLEIKAVKCIWGSNAPGGYGFALAFNVVCTFIDSRGNLRDTKRTKYSLGTLGSSPIPPLAAEIYVNPDDFEDYAVVLYRK